MACPTVYGSQADPTSVRAATRAATCHLKMGNLDTAQNTLDAVKATLPAGQGWPEDLAKKHEDLRQTKQWISEVCSRLDLDKADSAACCLLHQQSPDPYLTCQAARRSVASCRGVCA